jgi:hypothetical protein
LLLRPRKAASLLDTLTNSYHVYHRFGLLVGGDNPPIGTFSTYCIVSREQVIPTPAHLDDVHAAAWPVAGVTARGTCVLFFGMFTTRVDARSASDHDRLLPYVAPFISFSIRSIQTGIETPSFFAARKTLPIHGRLLPGTCDCVMSYRFIDLIVSPLRIRWMSLSLCHVRMLSRL